LNFGTRKNVPLWISDGQKINNSNECGSEIFNFKTERFIKIWIYRALKLIIPKLNSLFLFFFVQRASKTISVRNGLNNSIWLKFVRSIILLFFALLSSTRFICKFFQVKLKFDSPIKNPNSLNLRKTLHLSCLWTNKFLLGKTSWRNSLISVRVRGEAQTWKK